MSPTTSTRPPWPHDVPELTPLAPFAYSVWKDGVLSREEVDALCGFARERLPLTPDAEAGLTAWLDPDDPPTPLQLDRLAARIRAVELDADADPERSLTDLGLALWRVGEAAGPWGDAEAVEALRALEAALGLPGREAARRALGVRADVDEAEAPEAGFDADTLLAYLDRPEADTRRRVRQLLLAPEMRMPLGLETEPYRARVLEAVRLLASEGVGSLGYPEAHGGAGNEGAALAAFETLAYGDLSVLVKFGVQFGLFGGSVLQLGTEKHHARYLSAIGSLELPGCYAMTETGHGSNVRDLETTAEHDPETDELIVHTPHEDAGKDWIGGAARDGRLGTVFARLVVGGVDHGVHALLVPVRDEAGRPLPGVRIEDRGLKEGLNGVDNGRIWFDHVRVPRENLLDRFAAIDDAGEYSSPIPSSGRRFFTMLGTLVAGRVSIASAAVSAAKVGLTIAIRYTDGRRQFGPGDGPEQPVLDYLALQRELLPRLASVYAAHFAAHAVQAEYAAGAGEEDQSVEVSAAAIKAYASELCVETLQACREACGGQGYLAENAFARLKADTDVYTTFEGANLVLYQLVAKGLLSRYRDEMGDLSLWSAVRYLADRAETRLTELNPVVTRRTDEEHLLDPAFHASAFAYREARLMRSLAGRLRTRLSEGVDSFQALNEVQDHVVELARAHAEHLLLRHMQEAVAHAPVPGLSETLRSLSSLYALSRIEANRGWYLEVGYLEPPKSRAVRGVINRLCREVREYALLLVAGFGIPEELLPEIGRA